MGGAGAGSMIRFMIGDAMIFVTPCDAVDVLLRSFMYLRILCCVEELFGLLVGVDPWRVDSIRRNAY